MSESSKGLPKKLKPNAADDCYWCTSQSSKAVLCRQALHICEHHRNYTWTTFTDCFPNEISEHYV